MNRSTALITGATSGIGLATADRLERDGFNVYGVSRSQDKVSERNAEYADRNIRFSTGDVTDPVSIRGFMAGAVETFGPLAILVNNAGRNGGGETATMTDDLWDDVIETNLNSVFRVTREALRNGGLLADGGRIVSVSSTGGKQGVAFAAPYCASKSGIIGFTKSLALELALSGVTVNAVCPGFVETPMAERVRAGHAAHFGKTMEEVQKGFEENIPIGRYVAADEVAAMISFLATKNAASITGQAINVCGGLGRY